MKGQLNLFADFSAILCTECGAELRDLADLRRHCVATQINHLVGTPDYFTLYRRSEGNNDLMSAQGV